VVVAAERSNIRPNIVHSVLLLIQFLQLGSGLPLEESLLFEQKDVILVRSIGFKDESVEGYDCAYIFAPVET